MIDGLNKGSIASLNIFSNIFGMTLSRTFEGNYKQGLLLTYINKGLKLLSMMKSSPKISKENFFFF